MRDKIFTPRKAIIRDKRGRDKESRLYILLALDKTSFNPEIFTVFTQFGTTYLLAILLKFEIVHSITCWYVCMANSVDPDQLPSSAASDLTD